MLISTRQNVGLEKKFAHVIKKDVLATYDAVFWRFKPTSCGEGTEITHVISVNPNGKIPNFLMTKFAAKGISAALDLTNLIKSRRAKL